MKQLVIISMILLSMSCKKESIELTGMEGKLVNQKGEVQKGFKIYYSVYEFIPNGFVGGDREIKSPVEIISDSMGSFKISEMLKYRQSINVHYPTLSNNDLVDTFYVKAEKYVDPNSITFGNYYKDVLIVVKK